MRSILLSIMLCLVSSVNWGQTALWTDLVENPGDELIYKKFLTMPFTGPVTATADVSFHGLYKDGSIHGEWVEFSANGLMKSRSIIIEGQLQGKFNYKDGETHGTQERFDRDGSLLSSFELKSGKVVFD
jgi:antitoxin component YwqK of YwqJK toxin-antitoxin module